MILLSVNVNKFATLRNARGQNNPDLLQVCKDIVSFGARGLTVHPRPDERHITRTDLFQISQWVGQFNESCEDSKKLEFNIEGYPSREFLNMMEELRPDQCTLVPDTPDVLTSNAGWLPQESETLLAPIVARFKELGVRSSLFISPFDIFDSELAALERIAPDRVELYTESYAENFCKEKREPITEVYRKVAQRVFELGIEINAGHDLNLDNLSYLVERLPMLKEVSIGHALVCESLYLGLERTVKSYLRTLLDAANL
ncbi:pyridoxine 5'-phosphate synthase [Bdellovibrionales bacterium]|nr:pyridoxine 5'-phosphate synthase [Bdellovibrionales bacterium]